MSIYMWKVSTGRYMIQADEPKTARKLSRRDKCTLVAWGVNNYLRIFQISNLRADNARRMLRHVLDQENVLSGSKST
jgi:hypothetical protein